MTTMISHSHHPERIAKDKPLPRFGATLLASLLLAAGWAGEAYAVCSPYPPGLPGSTTLSALPSSLVLQRVGIGQVMASARVSTNGVGAWVCQHNDVHGMTAITGMLLADGYSNVYQTGIDGIGVRFGFQANHATWDGVLYPAFQVTTPTPTRDVHFPDNAIIEFIRTGAVVGSGAVSFDMSTQFYINTSPMSSVQINGSHLGTTLINNSYYSSCRNAGVDPTVDMQRATPSQIRNGTAAQHGFALDIRCDNAISGSRPPVKIYFAGSVVGSGLIALDRQGQNDVAKGVGVKLTDSVGAALPFSSSSALTLAWNSSSAGGDFYRFDGRARYAPIGGEITAGKGDATLTYVLQYN